MLEKVQFRILLLLASAVAVLVVTNATLFTLNRGMQREVAGRAQFVAQAGQLEPLYRTITQGLADLSVRNNDVQLKGVLDSQGISVSVNQPPAAPAAPVVVPKR